MTNARRSSRPTPSLPAALLAALLAPGAAGAFAIDHLQDKTDIGMNKVPHKGTSHVLVIPSRVGTERFPQGRLDELREYFDPDGGPGTYRSYWQIQSHGTYDPIPFLVEPVLYPDTCPIPGKTMNNCKFEISDAQLLFSGAVRDALGSLVRRVRDEQEIDLSLYDINGLEDGVPDGWIDGIILDTDLFEGLGLPLGALNQEVFVGTAPQPLPVLPDGGPDADGGPLADGGDPEGTLDAGAEGDAGATGFEIGIGIVAFIPPDSHEFGHNLGFMDLYGGPVITGLMGRSYSGLSAHSRLQIGWGSAVDVTEPMEIELEPVLEGGSILRFGSAPRYVLLENRAGFLHNQTEADYPGVYTYTIDENELPQGEVGFLDLQRGDLYLPNRPEPRTGNLDCVDRCYLNVNTPLNCRYAPASDFESCVMNGDGLRRDIEHATDGHLGFYVEQVSRALDGSVVLRIHEGRAPDLEGDGGPTPDGGAAASDAGPRGEDPQCGCQTTGPSESGGALALLGLLVLPARRRRA